MLSKVLPQKFLKSITTGYSERPGRRERKICNDEVSHLVFERSKMKAASAKNNCIAKIKIINKIQYIKTHKNHGIVFYIIVFLHSEQSNFFYII